MLKLNRPCCIIVASDGNPPVSNDDKEKNKVKQRPVPK